MLPEWESQADVAILQTYKQYHIFAVDYALQQLEANILPGDVLRRLITDGMKSIYKQRMLEEASQQ